MLYLSGKCEFCGEDRDNRLVRCERYVWWFHLLPGVAPWFCPHCQIVYFRPSISRTLAVVALSCWLYIWLAPESSKQRATAARLETENADADATLASARPAEERIAEATANGIPGPSLNESIKPRTSPKPNVPISIVRLYRRSIPAYERPVVEQTLRPKNPVRLRRDAVARVKAVPIWTDALGETVVTAAFAGPQSNRHTVARVSHEPAEIGISRTLTSLLGKPTLADIRQTRLWNRRAARRLRRRVRGTR